MRAIICLLYLEEYNRFHELVYFEYTSDIAAAIAREKQLKNWTREEDTGFSSGLTRVWCRL